METNKKTKGDILAERIEVIDRRYLLGAASYEMRQALAEYRAPWALGRSVNGFTLGDGQEWHRNDWTEGMLPDGWRPLLLGECAEVGDQDAPINNWKEACGGYYTKETIRCRTRRPLPEVKKPVPLGPEDVPPGSAIRKIGAENWMMVVYCAKFGVFYNDGTQGSLSFNFMKDHYEISRDGGKTWQKCEKEAK